MRLFQALRRSLKNDKEKVNHISITPKSAIAIVPPKKVIRALYDYEAQSSQELSFQKGDFFHVIGRENDTDWYEACNPALPDARGLVPVAFFQALGKTERDSGQSDKSSPQAVRMPDHDSGYSDTSGSGTLVGTDTARSSKTMGKGSGAMVYGIVMYDFAAERPDELDAKAGEAIIVIAQSNPEWFVAKPIGRLGGPGLIPVSFIEIRDMTSGQAVPDAQEAVQRAGVPKVEEWKKMAAEYKNSSITLGKFEAPNQQQQQQMEQGMERMSLQQRQSNGYQAQMRQSQQARTMQQQQVQQNSYAAKSNSQLYAPISARIPRYCFAEDKYWFVIEAALEDGRHWELSRYYEDFYDFQIALLTEFPAEAGNTGTQKRSLPYMPGPVNYVTDAITEGRQHNLDAYVKNLLTQPPYISRCTLVKQFFAPREGDYEIDPNAVNEEYRLSGGSQPSSTDSPTNGASRQSSRGNLNGGGYQGGLSAAPGLRPNGQQPTRQTSSLSQSTSSASPGLNGGGQPSAIKIKIKKGDETIAIRVPTEIQFEQLYEKIKDRLRIPDDEDIMLSYNDEQSGTRPSMLSNNDLDIALSRNDKLMLYVE
ncbi:related to bud emergence mediator BEM1 [Phialocephala subalpina]|uniref:Related to bud emergence mediator BEM1 n=1 Tax=Phialocephala subalpina TaxID=576137 RepID=A0A1L7XRZ8_9HELO|nr:related to bud emergence mediator BEM1 [Phialocephala subalpina]